MGLIATGSRDEIEDWVEDAFETDEDIEIKKEDFGNKAAFRIAERKLSSLQDRAERTVRGRVIEKTDGEIRARSVSTGRFVRVTKYLRNFARRIGLID